MGGYLEAKRIHDLALAAGVGVWCGGMLEIGIGRAANTALSALPGFTLIGDISGPDRFYTNDNTALVIMHDGVVTTCRPGQVLQRTDPGGARPIHSRDRRTQLRSWHSDQHRTDPATSRPGVEREPEHARAHFR